MKQYLLAVGVLSLVLLVSCMFLTELTKAETVGFTSTLDTSEMKTLFKDFFKWDLEYKRYVTSEWVNGNQYLTILKNWNGSSVKFSLVLDVPISVYSGRFTFVCNRTIMDYVNISSSEIYINYMIDNNIIKISFNYSDLRNIQGLTFSHGNLNGYFWFRFQKNNIPIGHYVFDPSFSLVSTVRSLYKQDASWTTCRSATTGTAYNTWLQDYSGEDVGNNRYSLYRGYFVFDTSIIPDTSSIQSVYLSVGYNYDNGVKQRHYYLDSNTGGTVETSEYNRANFGDVYGYFSDIGTGTYNTSLSTSSVSTTSYTTIVLLTGWDYNNTTPPTDTAGAIGTNTFTTVKLWVVYIPSIDINVESTNASTSYTAVYNNSSMIWVVNFTAETDINLDENLGNSYLAGTLTNNYNSATGVYNVFANYSGADNTVYDTLTNANHYYLAIYSPVRNAWKTFINGSENVNLYENIVDATGEHEKQWKASHTALSDKSGHLYGNWSVWANYTGTGTEALRIYLFENIINATGTHTYTTNETGYIVNANYTGNESEAFDGNESDIWLYTGDTITFDPFIIFLAYMFAIMYFMFNNRTNDIFVGSKIHYIFIISNTVLLLGINAGEFVGVLSLDILEQAITVPFLLMHFVLLWFIEKDRRSKS